MKQKFIDYYMKVAKLTGELSYARRLQVGAVIVKNDSVISYGYNGMPAGWDNNCEYEMKWPNGEIRGLKTKEEVLHAEMNALMKLAKSHSSGENASMFVTHAPCLDCAKGIYQAGIKEVIYQEEYRNIDGIEFLEKCNIRITKFQPE